MAQVGDHVYSPNAKSEVWAFRPVNGCHQCDFLQSTSRMSSRHTSG
jgi:hypothetical protein